MQHSTIEFWEHELSSPTRIQRSVKVISASRTFFIKGKLHLLPHAAPGVSAMSMNDADELIREAIGYAVYNFFGVETPKCYLVRQNGNVVFLLTEEVPSAEFKNGTEQDESYCTHLLATSWLIGDDDVVGKDWSNLFVNKRLERCQIKIDANMAFRQLDDEVYFHRAKKASPEKPKRIAAAFAQSSKPKIFQLVKDIHTKIEIPSDLQSDLERFLQKFA